MTTDDKYRLTLFLHPSLVKQARAQAVAEDTTLTAIVERSLTKYLPNVIVIKKHILDKKG